MPDKISFELIKPKKVRNKKNRAICLNDTVWGELYDIAVYHGFSHGDKTNRTAALEYLIRTEYKAIMSAKERPEVKDEG